MSTRLAVPFVVLLACLAAPGGAQAAPRDRDHDGLPDKWERQHHLSTTRPSAKGDPDHDRLSNLREYRLGTNPRKSDSDGDGLSDRAEVLKYQTNPMKADSDRDGVGDAAEVKAGSNPMSRAGE